MTDSNDTDEIAERIADSVREQLETDDSSRRSFLSRSAVAGGALLALGGGTGLALGDEHGEAGTEEEPMDGSFDDVSGTDLDVLNYALTLEHLENAFYNEALEMFDEDAFMEADALQPYSEELRQAVYTHVQTVGEQEQTHVEVLTQAVDLLGGDPAMEKTYDFGIENMEDFLGLAKVFENTGVAAYAGAASYIESPDLLNVALAIHSVEARHAAMFNQLNGVSPFPSAFDEALSQQEVLAAVGPFIESADTETDESEDSEESDDSDDAEGEGSDGTGNESSTNGSDSSAGDSANNSTDTESTAVDEGASDPGNETGNTTSTEAADQ